MAGITEHTTTYTLTLNGCLLIT